MIRVAAELPDGRAMTVQAGEQLVGDIRALTHSALVAEGEEGP